MKIALSEWAARNFNPSPSPFVLRGMIKKRRIVPYPERIGKSWYVDEDAVVVAANALDDDPVVRQIWGK